MKEKSELNEQQLEASQTLNGPLLIVAGAGAGKTKTISHRILELVKSGVNPSSILAITFTNKAAKEMRTRILKLLSEDKSINLPIKNEEVPFIATFHSLGVHILRENAQKVGLNRNFTIYDRQDSKTAVKRAMEVLGLDPKELEPSSVLNVISKAKNNLIEWQNYDPEKKDMQGSLGKRIWPEYEKILKRDNALDFDDLLVKTTLLLKHNPEIRLYYSKIWKYIHVDEYQDTNKAQYEIAKALSKEGGNICVVGDADQTIYSWRGANLQNILDFEKDYPNAKVILLEQNYRSTKTILEAANKIISKNLLRKEKRLFTENIKGDKIQLIETLTEKDEARTIADKVADLISEDVSPKDIAVLYRTNFQSRVLEEFMLRKNIPYQVLGTRFFDRKEVKDIISYLRASLNPENTADISRTINTPARGIGKVTLAKVLAGDINTLSPSIKQKVGEYYSILRRIKEIIETNKTSSAVALAIRESGIERNLKEGKFEDLDALENLGELVSLATKYDHQNGTSGMEALLTDIALATDQDQMEDKSNSVKLMTVHTSKGLEFDYVFICGLEKELFPHTRSDEGEQSTSEREEERRLFYVAITRAKKKIYLLFSRMRTIFGTEKYNEPSEFIGDLDGDLLEKEEIEEATGIKAIFIDF